MSGILHFVNQTPIIWFAKRQNTVETATYGSEFMASRQATEQIIDLRYTLRMFGVPLDGPSWLFGDNQSVITSSTIPHSALNKRHNALSYHKVREAIAAKYINFIKIDGKNNPADILTKFSAWSDYWPLVQPILFRKGETMKEHDKNRPIPEIISEIRSASLTGLRGVSNSSPVPANMLGKLGEDIKSLPASVTLNAMDMPGKARSVNPLEACNKNKKKNARLNPANI
jgi:hypothetical protein